MIIKVAAGRIDDYADFPRVTTNSVRCTQYAVPSGVQSSHADELV